MEKDYNKDLSFFPNHYAGILSKYGLEKITGINPKATMELFLWEE